MKRLLIAVALSATAVTAPALAADVGVSISIGQPGFYGRLDIGDYPAPQLIYSNPIAVYGVPGDRPPIYLHVPPGQARNWRRHCHEYNACGERVYFVRDNWYQHEYVPRYQERHREYRDNRRDDRRGDRNDHYGRDRGEDRGHGRDR